MLKDCQKSCSVCIDKSEYTDCEEEDDDGCDYCDDNEPDCVEWALRGDVSFILLHIQILNTIIEYCCYQSVFLTQNLWMKNVQ